MLTGPAPATLIDLTEMGRFDQQRGPHARRTHRRRQPQVTYWMREVHYGNPGSTKGLSGRCPGGGMGNAVCRRLTPAPTLCNEAHGVGIRMVWVWRGLADLVSRGEPTRPKNPSKRIARTHPLSHGANRFRACGRGRRLRPCPRAYRAPAPARPRPATRLAVVLAAVAQPEAGSPSSRRSPCGRPSSRPATRPPSSGRRRRAGLPPPRRQVLLQLVRLSSTPGIFGVVERCVAASSSGDVCPPTALQPADLPPPRVCRPRSLALQLHQAWHGT